MLRFPTTYMTHNSRTQPCLLRLTTRKKFDLISSLPKASIPCTRLRCKLLLFYSTRCTFELKLALFAAFTLAREVWFLFKKQAAGLKPVVPGLTCAAGARLKMCYPSIYYVRQHLSSFHIQVHCFFVYRSGSRFVYLYLARCCLRPGGGA